MPPAKKQPPKKSSSKTDSSSSIDFATSIKKLETIVNKMQSEDLDLEKSLHNFAEGVKLVKSCQQGLQQAQQKVDILMQDMQQEGAALEVFNQQTIADQADQNDDQKKNL